MSKERKVGAMVSEDCYQDLVLLKGYLRLPTMPDVVKQVLEKHCQQMLSKVANKYLKSINVDNEDK
jgi:hypothetical protein